MEINERILSKAFESSMQGRFTSDQYRAVSGDDLLVLKAVWMCVVAPRTETLHLDNGHNGDTDAEFLYLTTVPFPVTSDIPSVTRLENYIAPEHSKVFILPDKRSAVVNVDQAVRPRNAIWLRVISAIPMLLPWLFEGEQKLQPDEYALLQLVYKISQKDNAASRKDFLAATAPFIAKYAYDMIEYRSAAQEITVNAQADQIRFISRNIEDAEQEIKDYQRRISDQLRLIAECNARIAYLRKTDTNQLRQEVYDYLRSGGFRIDNISSGNGYIQYTVLTTLSCYDEDMVDSYVLNYHDVLDGYSSIGRGSHEIDNPYTNDQMAAFYRAVFVDHRFTIKMAATYTIDRDAGVRAVEADNPMDPIAADYINNPHIAFVSCLGGYSSDLADAERNHDYIAALAITQQSASNVSLSETWAMGRVTQQLVLGSGKVIRTQDGTDITFKEAMQIICDEMDGKEA